MAFAYFKKVDFFLIVSYVFHIFVDHDPLLYVLHKTSQFVARIFVFLRYTSDILNQRFNIRIFNRFLYGLCISYWIEQSSSTPKLLKIFAYIFF